MTPASRSIAGVSPVDLRPRAAPGLSAADPNHFDRSNQHYPETWQAISGDRPSSVSGTAATIGYDSLFANSDSNTASFGGRCHSYFLMCPRTHHRSRRTHHRDHQ